MIKSPKVYIVVLNYNSFEDTKECIRSLDKIYYKNYNIVIVDNCSSDGSYEKLINIFSDYTIIRTDKNLGYAYGNNAGIKFGLDNGADYICILNSDVIVEKDFLDKLVSKIEENDKIGIAGSCICDYHEKDIVQSMGANINLYFAAARRKFKGENYFSIDSSDVDADYVEGACLLIKRDVFKSIGFIPENYFLFFEETEFCLKARKAGYKVMCIYASRVYHKGSSTISKFSNLSYSYLNRNRVIFVRRNSKWYQKIIFSVYIFIEGIGRILIRREPLALLKYFFKGFLADKYNTDEKEILKYTRH